LSAHPPPKQRHTSEGKESLTIASQRNAGALSVLLFIRFSAWMKRGC